MYTYDDYDYGVINESALDMAMDMSDRYGVAIEDAYDFACDAMEGSLKDPRKRTLRELGRAEIADKSHSASVRELDLRDDALERARRKMYNKDGIRRAAYAELKYRRAENDNRRMGDDDKHARGRFRNLHDDTKTYPYRDIRGDIVHPDENYAGYQRAISKLSK